MQRPENGSTATPHLAVSTIDSNRWAPGEPPITPGELSMPEPTKLVPLDQLQPGESPRLTGESAEHARVLAESGDNLPPILVHRETMRVVDGAHRVRAAKLRGDEAVVAQFVDGTEEEAFIRAVQANLTHGLPLSMADREAAALRVVQAYPYWSDKAVAQVVGLAPGTVGAIRRRSAAGGEPAARLGRDGRMRPLDWAKGRIAASRIIAERPEASLREVAREAGVSPATVRDVRARLARGEDPVPARWRSGRNGAVAPGPPAGDPRPISGPVSGSGSNPVSGPVGGSVGNPVGGQAGDGWPDPGRRDASGREGGPARVAAEIRTVLEQLRADPSLRYNESGRAAWRWLFTHAMGLDDWPQVVDAIPPHCVYLLSGLARRCADDWLALAERLENKRERQG